MRILESERLVLKPVEESDLQYLLDLRWELSVMEYLIHEPLSLADQLKWYKNLTNKDLPLCIFIKTEDSQLNRAGTVGLYDINRRHQRAVFRIRIDPNEQRKGIAYEAANMVLDYGFNTLNINKVTSDTFADNEAVIKLNLKIGLRKEGLLYKHYYHKGEFRDAIVFGLLKEEFKKAKLTK